MNRLPVTGRKLLQLLAYLAASLLMLAVLVIIPLKTHQTPTPDARLIQSHPVAAPTPTFLPDPAAVSLPDPNSPVEDQELLLLLNEFTGQHPGVWDIYVFNLSHGEYASCSTADGSPMISASLIKLFIMGAAYEQVQAGKLNYWEVYNSVRYMIVASDNYSANYLTLRLGDNKIEDGFDYVNAFALAMGCENTAMHRLMLDTDSGEENYTSAKDCALLLKKIYRCELVSPEYSNDMLKMLKEQFTNDRIPALLPDDAVCAHKTGDLSNLSCGDAGIVFSPNADYILSVINNHSENDPETIQAIAELSALIYEYYNPPIPETPAPEEEPQNETDSQP